MNNSIESIEKLLRGAATFEPAQRFPDDIVDRAMSRVQQRRRSTATWAVAIGACAVAWIALSQLRTPTPRSSTAQHPEKSGLVIALNHDSDPGNIGVAPRKKIEKRKPQSQIERKATHSKITTRKPQNIARRKNPNVEQHSSAGQRPILAALPKAIWRDEEVHTYRTGVVAAAWVLRADEDNRIQLQPGIVQVPLAEGQLIARTDTRLMKEERP